VKSENVYSPTMWTLSALLARTDSEFEALMADLWSAMGYELLRGPVGGADTGIDVLVRTRTRPQITVCIQAKRYQPPTRVGVREIREYASLLHRADIDVVTVVTTSSFTAEAEREAAEHGVKLIDGSELLSLLSSSGLPAPFASPQEAWETAGQVSPTLTDRQTTGAARTHPGWGWTLVVLCVGGIGAVATGDAEWWAIFLYIIMACVGAGLLV